MGNGVNKQTSITIPLIPGFPIPPAPGANRHSACDNVTTLDQRLHSNAHAAESLTNYNPIRLLSAESWHAGFWMCQAGKWSSKCEHHTFLMEGMLGNSISLPSESI